MTPSGDLLNIPFISRLSSLEQNNPVDMNMLIGFDLVMF